MADENIAASGIYSIRRISDGKSYIGSAINLPRRWQEHRKTLRGNRHHSRKLQRAWNVHGEAAFVFAVIEVVADPANLIAREQHWIDALDACKAGFNSRPSAGNQLGLRHRPETRAKMRESAKGRRRPGPRGPFSAETRAKMSAASKARVRASFSDETRARISRGIAKVTEDDVRAIRRRAANGEKRSLLAAEYGLKYAAVAHIVTGINWKHVEPEFAQQQEIAA